MGYEERTAFLRAPLHLQRQIQPYGILKFTWIIPTFLMDMIEAVLDRILMQIRLFAGLFEGHIAGKINTKQFKVFRRKLIQSFL